MFPLPKIFCHIQSLSHILEAYTQIPFPSGALPGHLRHSHLLSQNAVPKCLILPSFISLLIATFFILVMCMLVFNTEFLSELNYL